MPRRKMHQNDAVKQAAYRKRKKAARIQVHFQSLLDVRETPQDLFVALDREFGFTLDVCALPTNAKCARYFTPEEDGLHQKWEGACFMNPPYGTQIGAWLKKACKSAQEGATVVCVLPARTDSYWWHEYVMKAEVRYLRDRLRFRQLGELRPLPHLHRRLPVRYLPPT